AASGPMGAHILASPRTHRVETILSLTTLFATRLPKGHECGFTRKRFDVTSSDTRRSTVLINC
ncbi:hypothetical protein HDU93_005603, partial [Gonapodya sp. JEL0774]